MISQALLPLLCCIGVETAQHVAFGLAGTRPHQRLAWMLLGMALHVVLLMAWCWLLVIVPLGIAAPLTGMTYLTIALASRFALNEQVKPRAWVGIAGIAIGFALIAVP